MSAAGPLAAASVLLAIAAVGELSRARRTVGRSIVGPAATGWGAGAAGRRAAGAALRLGLPGRLRRAGLADRWTLAGLLAVKLATSILAALTAALVAPLSPGRVSVLIAVGLPVAGFLLPDLLLERRARRRRRDLLAALPDALDLLAVSVTAGRGPLQGLARIADAASGPLAEELRPAVAAASCGVPLSTALAGLRDRVPGAEMATLVAAIERSRRLGSPLADQLREQATGLRRRHRRAVEEQAARAAPKIQLVVALVLVPSVLLMIAAALLANAGTLLNSP